MAKSVTTLTDTRVVPLEKEVKLLIEKDALFGRKLSDLESKDQKFDDRLAQLDKREMELYHQLK